MSPAFDLKKIADLAYLKLTKEEEQKLLPKLQQVIEYVGKIQNLKLDTIDIQEFSPERQRFRADEAKTQKIDIEKLSPFTEENYFVVPKVIQDFE